MANYVKISTIGAKPFGRKQKTEGQEVVGEMIKYLKEQIEQVLPDKPDLIVLTECCDRYEGMSREEQTKYYKFRGNKIRNFISEIASKNNCYIAYSAVRELEDGTMRNSTQIIDRTGNITGIYDKNNVVIEETTQSGVFPGKEAPLIKCDFGNVACAICFDLNFDKLRLEYVEKKPDIILFSSMYHGGLMQNYWAYSCRCYFVGAVAGLPSAVISPVGEIIASSTNYFDFVTARINLDCCIIHLDYHWDKIRAMKKKYGDKVKIFDPDYLAAILISIETDEFTVNDIINEFKIELLDDYFKRALEHQEKYRENCIIKNA